MLTFLPTSILENILSFGDNVLNAQLSDSEMFPAVEFIASIRNDIRPLYYRYCAMLHKPVRLNCFTANPVTPSILNSDFFRYVAQQSNLVIAGGFATQLYAFPYETPSTASDIDLFVLKQDVRVVQHLLTFLIENGVETMEQNSYRNIFQFRFSDLQYTIQLILLESVESVYDVIKTFDMSYCRCVIYRGEVFATPDAHVSLKTRKTILYKSARMCRIEKARRYVDVFLNAEMRSSCDCINQTIWKRVAVTQLQKFSKYIVRRQRLFRTDAFVFRNISDYVTGHHRLARRTLIRKTFTISDTEPRFNYLEWFVCAPSLVTFKLQYFIPDDTAFFIKKNYFYTADKRFNDVFDFWISKTATVRSCYERFKRSSRIKKCRKHFSCILKPMSTCFAYLPVQQHLTAKWQNGNEYELSVAFLERNIAIADYATLLDKEAKLLEWFDTNQ